VCVCVCVCVCVLIHVECTIARLDISCIACDLNCVSLAVFFKFKKAETSLMV